MKIILTIFGILFLISLFSGSKENTDNNQYYDDDVDNLFCSDCSNYDDNHDDCFDD